MITLPLYMNQGGTEGILRNYLNNVLKGLPADQRSIARDVLEQLITSENQRTRHTEAELADSLAVHNFDAQILPTILQQLVVRRLIIPIEAEREIEYELVHDYLAGEIQLSEATRASKAAQELLEQEVRAYQRYGTLLSDDKLAIIAARRGELALNDDATALIQKSERALRQRQRLVFGGIGLVIVLFIVGTLSVLAAVGAQSVADQANESAVTATVREAIANESLKRAFEKSGVVPVGNAPQVLAHGGARLWVANAADGTVQAVDPATGAVSTPVKVGTNPQALAYDGARLWVANASDDTVQAIDPATGDATAGAPIKVGTYPRTLAYDGTRLWVVNYVDDTVQYILVHKHANK